MPLDGIVLGTQGTKKGECGTESQVLTIGKKYLPLVGSFDESKGVNFRDVHIGEKIRRIRRERDWTQEYLAEKMNLSVAYISKIETGRSDPDSTLLKQFAAVLTVPIQQLFEEDTVRFLGAGPIGKMEVREGRETNGSKRLQELEAENERLRLENVALRRLFDTEALEIILQAIRKKETQGKVSK